MFSVKELQSLIDTIKQIVKQQTDDAFNKSESNTYGTIVADNGDNTYNVSVAGIDSILFNVINKSLLTLNVGDNVVIKSNIGNLSNGYIALKLGNGSVDLDVDTALISGVDYTITQAEYTELINLLGGGVIPRLLDFFMPIGTVLESTNSKFNPNALYIGTTWTKVENVMLLGSGSKTLGSTGGSETVTLTTEQMPSHTHTQNAHSHLEGSSTNPYVFITSDGDTTSALGAGISGTGYKYPRSLSSATISKASRTRTDTATNNNTGGSGSHNNMPPYRVVNIWERIS